MKIYHIVLPEIWESFDIDLYRHESLATEGFIHCSFDHQVDEVLERYYKNADRDYILEIETDHLMSRVINEPSTNSAIYPHIYGPINRAAITGVEERYIG